ncbi:LOW QUALITY PROTEIN: uncharacterized protein LOC112213594 [Bombus impatiens]|uniref:LOW QUALITY PROTEIN: uncharacterized protein LOC112213594 n=1 Tax=Bombus impatiens TaxID=132113 RepID=A0A6P8L4Y4_BOMIM|nr:LOW QUALITY PROTEIN: uncharacterized protein LOC112213594 [Bombus impatiens]
MLFGQYDEPRVQLARTTVTKGGKKSSEETSNAIRDDTATAAATAANDSISTRQCTSAAAAYLEYDSLAKVLLPTGSTSPGALRETIHGIAGKTMTDRIRKLDFAFHHGENVIFLRKVILALSINAFSNILICHATTICVLRYNIRNTCAILYFFFETQ